MHISSDPHSWYAVRVRSRSEKLAAAGLIQRGITVCEATAPVRRVWIDRIRTIDMPLFPGYIFARVTPQERPVVLRGTGVAGIVGFGGVDSPIPDTEIESVRILVRSGAEVDKSPFLNVGQKVRVRWGPLSGVVGVLEQIKNRSRIVITVEFLLRSVAVEVDPALVETLPPGEQHHHSAARHVA